VNKLHYIRTTVYTSTARSYPMIGDCIDQWTAWRYRFRVCYSWLCHRFLLRPISYTAGFTVASANTCGRKENWSSDCQLGLVVGGGAS